ncbi:oligosaccharide flippase family protein [Sulfurimonas sp.]|uniref:lipopolysaccharide biosynthesis protein n=1 Tax=Sulfurimonas sp. TaxID=2022749 RepID=UPI00286DEC9D|nr:oligosaccharide flippase family protein [Sulfurimonas sp.]
MIRNSIIFTFLELVNKAVPFLLLPILTRYLSPNDYGVIASFTALVSFLGIFIGLSAHGAIDANYFKLKKEQVGIYIFNVLIVLLFITVIALITIIIYNDLIMNKLNIPLEWQIVSIFVAVSQFITIINLSLWIIEQKPVPYGMYQLFQTIFITSVSIVLVVGLSFDWSGNLLAISIGSLLSAFISLIFLKQKGYLIIKVNKEYLNDFLKFGIPMVPHQVSGWIRSQADKVIVVSTLGTAMTGLFVVGQQVGMVMSIFMSSLNKALYPFLYKKLNQKMTDIDKRNIVKTTYFIGFLIIIAALTLIILTEIIYPYLFNATFQNALLVTQLMIIGYLFEGLYYLIVNYLFYFKQTAKLAKVTFSISMVHICISILLVNLYGIIGAAYALIISGVLQFVFVWYLSNKIYPMPWFSFWKDKK